MRKRVPVQFVEAKPIIYYIVVIKAEYRTYFKSYLIRTIGILYYLFFDPLEIMECKIFQDHLMKRIFGNKNFSDFLFVFSQNL
jgi:hypothetical protein